jgi:chromosome segregation ATPase
MIRDIQNTASRYIRTLGEMGQKCEKFLRKPGYIPVVSTFTNGVGEVLAGMVVVIGALAAVAFYKGRQHIPSLFIKNETKILWRKEEDLNNAQQLLKDAVHMVGMGILKALPGIGNIGAYAIYTLVEQNRAAEKAKATQDQKITELIATIEDKEKALQASDADLKKVQAEIEKKEKTLKARNSEIKKLNDELKQLKETGAPGEEELRKVIAAKENQLLDVQQKLDTKTAEANTSTVKIQALEQEKVSRQKEWEVSIAQKEKALADRAKEQDLLQKQIADLKETIAKSPDKKDFLKKLEAKEQELKEKMEQIVQLEKVRSKLTKDLEGINSTHAVEVNKVKADLGTAQQEVIKLTKNSLNLSKELDKAKQTLSEVESSTKEKIEQYQHTLREAQEAQAQLEVQLNGEKDDVTSLKNENEGLKREIASLKKTKRKGASEARTEAPKTAKGAPASTPYASTGKRKAGVR